MIRRGLLVGVTAVMFSLFAVPAWACGGLVAPNGGINLVRTSTLSAYHDGVEHYVTSFEFNGEGGGEFGSIVPLPGVPTDVVKGGAWTLERLQLETQPPVAVPQAASFGAAADTAEKAEVILETRIEALKITVLEGGGDSVGEWATEHGFSLPPDAPEMLDFYAERSPIFMAVKFDVSEAKERGLESGDGTPVHVTIPTPNPWVPLRILGLGKDEAEVIDADVYLLTDAEPNLLPQAGGDSGMKLEFSEATSNDLLADLRSDKGMKWLPKSDMWLSYLLINTEAGNLTHDLAIDPTGYGEPSAVAAGLALPDGGLRLPEEANGLWPWLIAAALAFGTIAVANRAVSAKR
ncbi:MAG TPA: DUF2330 domain-containing protein [Actinomycetota bacterium]|nr:DUF2330 domain-containing protein [Actinomycetota bacterium]